MTTPGLSGTQPDILEVITDLSSDEVFTPPRVANAVLDLLPDDVWADPELRWLDPGCKTGVFLREITRRLMTGLAEAIPDEQERLEHILTNMVYGIAITELTALMSRRTLYCSKNASGPRSIVRFPTPEGNIWMRRVEHSYNAKGRCTECSASRAEMERPGRENYAYAFIHETGRHALAKEFDMRFDVIVGNPPYQMEADASGQNVMAIYDHFVDQAKALNPSYISMIIPSRWMAGGKHLDEFRHSMLTDRRIRILVDYPNAAELFPSVGINGGVCYFLWDSCHDGDCQVSLVREGNVVGPVNRQLDEFDVLVRDHRALNILHRVRKFEEPSLIGIISARDPFGPKLSSNFRGFTEERRRPDDLILHLNVGNMRKAVWVSADTVTKNKQLVDAWKVLLPKTGSGREREKTGVDLVLGPSLIAGPGSVCTLTYIVAGPLNSKSEAESLSSYLRTRFARFLVSLRKVSQDTPRNVYTWVPMQTWDRIWTDAELYEKYGITTEEQEYIEEMIREMPA
jgi:site-specific DNA-methyltransferase (adenine-specific)